MVEWEEGKEEVDQIRRSIEERRGQIRESKGTEMEPCRGSRPGGKY